MATRRPGGRDRKPTFWSWLAQNLREDGIWSSPDQLIVASGILAVCACAHIYFLVVGTLEGRESLFMTYMTGGAIFFGLFAASVFVRYLIVANRKQRRKEKRKAKANSYTRMLEQEYHGE